MASTSSHDPKGTISGALGLGFLTYFAGDRSIHSHRSDRATEIERQVVNAKLTTSGGPMRVSKHDYLRALDLAEEAIELARKLGRR